MSESTTEVRAGHADSSDRVSRRPIGILAAIIALVVSIVGAQAGQAYAVDFARHYLRAVGASDLPIKWTYLTFQRAALTDDHTLPMYGSSELYCCDAIYRAPVFFAQEPSGFATFAVGGPGTGDLAFAQMFAALGGDLRGRKLVVTDSPSWFYFKEGIPADQYAGSFSPEIAEMFAFDAPISMDLREAGARRMLAYPATLESSPLLRRGIEDLADPTTQHVVEYYSLYPAGRIDSWIRQVQDAWQTVSFIRSHPELRPDPAFQARNLDWIGLLAQATMVAKAGDTTNPFGIRDDGFKYLFTIDPGLVNSAMDLYCAGKSNRNNDVISFDLRWEETMLSSNEWTDLDLALRALRELDARPLVYSLPIPGVFDNYTPTSWAVRRGYYDKYNNVTAVRRLSALDLAGYDEDQYFLNDPGSHLSPRGWIFVNRAIDTFWHDLSIVQAQTILDDLQNVVPSGPIPAPPQYCGTSRPG